MRCLETFFTPVLDLDMITERCYITSQQANEAAKKLLEKEGIFCGQSAVAIYKAVQLASDITEGIIVTIIPDGGWKYISMDF